MARGEKTAEMLKKKKKEGNTQTHTCVHTLMGLHTQNWNLKNKTKKNCPCPPEQAILGRASCTAKDTQSLRKRSFLRRLSKSAIWKNNKEEAKLS